jgi:hypothetical protein
VADPKPHPSDDDLEFGLVEFNALKELSPSTKRRFLGFVARQACAALDRIRREFADTGRPPAPRALEALLELGAVLRESTPQDGPTLTPLPLAWPAGTRVVVRREGPARFCWELLRRRTVDDVELVICSPADGLEFETSDDAIADASAHWFGVPIVRDESCDDAPAASS